MALLLRSSEEKRDSLTQPLLGSRTDNQSRKAVNSRLSLKIPTLSPLLLPTATKPTSVPTPAKLTTNSVKLSIPPRLSLKSPPRSKKDHLTYDIDGESTTLTITNITKKDAGKYEVYCENDKGFDHSFATITVS